VNAIVEVPIGGEPIKYELDKAAGTLVVDRFLHTPMRYPGNYGFVPHTLSADGDPIDVLVANTRPIVPGAVINVRPIGVLKMVDDAGRDEKILAVPTPKLTKRYEHVTNYTDLPRITLEQVQHFFEHYKDLEPGKWVKMGGWGDAEEARQLIRAAIARAAQQRGKPPPKYAWTLQAARCATKGGGTTRPGAQHDAHPPFPCASSRADPCPRSDRSAL